MSDVIKLKHVARIRPSNVDKKTADGELSVRLCNYTDVYYHDVIQRDLEFMSASATPDQVRQFELRAGDVLITKDSETADDIAIPAFIAEALPGVLCGYHLSVIRPRRDRIDPKFLFWCMASTLVRSQAENYAAGITRVGIRSDLVGSLLVPYLPIERQRATANYLDGETSRIDSIIAKKRRMIELTEARRGAVIEATIRSLADEYGEAPLKRAVKRVEVGIVITPATWYAPEGVLALRGLNVARGRITLDDVVRLSPEGHRYNRKSELRAGDVVVVRTGKAGAAAVVPPELAGSNCIDLVIVRPSAVLLPKFLEYVLNSDWTQKRIEEHAVGSIQSHLNVGAMREIPVPRPPLDVQVGTVGLLARLTDRTNGVVSRLERQTDLLVEHRQALITAAVTGEMEIPGRLND
jgi:type I restriction enzyme S subunit